MSLLLRFDFVPDETMTPSYTRSDPAWRRAGGNSPDTAHLLYWALGQALPALAAAGDSARFPDGETDMGFLGEPTMRCSGWYPLLGLHACRGCLKHLRKSGRCLSHVWELLSPPRQESSVLLAAGLTFLVWVLPWVHCNGGVSLLALAPGKLRVKPQSVFTCVAPWYALKSLDLSSGSSAFSLS